MKIIFKVDTIEDHYEFKSIAKKNGQSYEFIDLMIEGSKIKLEIIKYNHLRLTRSGVTIMNLDFILNQKCNGNYSDSLGLSFEISSYTKEINIEDNRICFEYDYYMENIYENTLKVELIILSTKLEEIYYVRK